MTIGFGLTSIVGQQKSVSILVIGCHYHAIMIFVLLFIGVNWSMDTTLLPTEVLYITRGSSNPISGRFPALRSRGTAAPNAVDPQSSASRVDTNPGH